MDQNLTGLINACVSLSQPNWVIIVNALIGPFSAFMGALGVYLATSRNIAHEKSMEQKKEIDMEWQNRKELLVQLWYERRALAQLYFSKFEATLNSRVHLSSMEISIKLGLPNDLVAHDRDEQVYWKNQGNLILKEITLKENELSKTLGLISLSFPETEELDKLINQVNKIRTLAPPRMPEFNKVEGLYSWKDSKICELHEKVLEIYIAPIDNLINYLTPLVKDRSFVMS